jgi:hypothetical protein
MANQIYRDRIISLIKEALNQYEGARLVDHPFLSGRIREIAAANIFKPLLPSGFEVGTGKIVDARGFQSPETDLVIYNRNTLPPIMYSDREGIFPAEATMYSIEIKSQLTARELDETIRKAGEIRKLTYTTGIYDENDKPLDHRFTSIIPTLFAFSSDLSGECKSEIDRYIERDSQADVNPNIVAICIVGKGYWWFGKNKKWE